MYIYVVFVRYLFSVFIKYGFCVKFYIKGWNFYFNGEISFVDQIFQGSVGQDVVGVLYRCQGFNCLISLVEQGNLWVWKYWILNKQKGEGYLFTFIGVCVFFVQQDMGM